jgi:hypothetical protein
MLIFSPVHNSDGCPTVDTVVDMADEAVDEDVVDTAAVVVDMVAAEAMLFLMTRTLPFISVVSPQIRQCRKWLTFLERLV